MKRLAFRLVLGLAFGLPLALVSIAFAQSGTEPEAVITTETECQDCHENYQIAWEGGAHGQATSDTIFQEAWEAQGRPGDCLSCHTTGYNPVTGTYHAEGVTCAACHNPIDYNHPLSPASMSRSASLCGDCHTDTYFEWQSSQHGKSDLTCVSCHDPHATTIRASDAATLCASCHGTRVAAFGHSKHAEEGLTCTDCHIGEAEGALGMGRGQHSHAFTVDLSKCTKCHEAELHSPAAAMLTAAETPLPPDSMSSGKPDAVTTDPQPNSPTGWAIITGLLGLAFGIVLAPWLERGFHRFTHADAHPEVRS